jgi:hypothetical protein
MALRKAVRSLLRQHDRPQGRSQRAFPRGAGHAPPALEALEDRVVPSTTYEVGPGQLYATIGAVPWGNLGPGDSVRIHYQAQPYRQKILLSNSGAAGPTRSARSSRGRRSTGPGCGASWRTP